MNRLLISLLACISLIQAYAATYSGTLPVMFINTEGGAQITSKTDYVNATFWFDPMGTPDIEPVGSSLEPLPLQIKGRGNYTWTGFQKKPYRIKLETKAPLAGLNKSKHFALLAAADDPNAYLRNVVGNQMSRLIGLTWTPADPAVELVINNEYLGVYFLTETIRPAKHRVPIIEQPDYETDPELITGGWLVEIDNYDQDPHVEITEGNGWPIYFTYKSPEALSPQQERYLTDQMRELNRRIYSNDKASWLDMVDLDELAKFYIVQEILDDYESFHGSCYMWKDQGSDTKWMFGPVWDFGSAMFSQKSQYIYEGRQWHQTWIAQMCSYPQFIDRVKELWAQFYKSDFQSIYKFLDNYSTTMSTALRHDRQRWQHAGYGEDNVSNKVNEVKRWLTNSAKWLNEQWAVSAPNPNPNPNPEPLPINTLEVYLRASDCPWPQAHLYVWDFTRDGGVWEVLGSWTTRPEMSLIDINGEQFWHYFTELPHELNNPFLNFSCKDPKEQTDDFECINGGFYSVNGFYGMSGAQPSTADPALIPVEYFDLQGRPASTPLPKGIYLRRQGTSTTKIVVR